MDERSVRQPEQQPVRPRRRRKQTFWKRYGPTVQLLLVCLAVICVLIYIGNVISDNITQSQYYENTADNVRTVQKYSIQATRSIVKTQPALTADPVGGVIYLTFDDGPGKDTPRLLEILEQYDVKATFFLVNTGYASTISQIAEAGHALAMHTATHDFEKVYASEDAYFADLAKIQSVIEQYSGQAPTLIRFPGGSSNRISASYTEGIMTRLTALVEEQGYTYFDWNVDSDDAGSAKTSREVFLNVIRGCATRESSVVLMHDIKSYTVDAVEDILVWGLANGYTFEALTADSPTFHHTVNN